MLNEPLLKVGIGQRLWDIEDESERLKAIEDYLALGYENWRLVRLEYPNALCERR